MKIGILTHHYINNFGAFLQAYSLQEAVKKICPNDKVYIIDYINVKHSIINTCGWFRFYKNKETIGNWSQKIRLPKTFKVAREKDMNLSKRCYSVNAVNKLKLDYIIVGSDEVWNYKETKGNAKIKFGEGLTCKNLIAYAPSVGQTYEEIVPDYVLNGIKKFKAVSARDELTEKMAENIRKEVVTRVVDPTFLANIPVEPVDMVKKPYILFYYCDGLADNEKKKILDYAKANCMNVYGAGECDKRYSDTTVNLTPYQWVWMFKNARYVITGTFHGVVFSMLNHRDYACYMTNPSRIKKVASLIAEFDLSDRRDDSGLAENLIKIINTPIDYETVEKKFEKRREESIKFLSDAINA